MKIAKLYSMKKIHNADLTDLSQKLRKEMTKEERHIWYDFLKGLSVPVYRQRTFGRYIVDFYCPSAKLVIELDGSQHYDESGVASDFVRDEYLRSLGLSILRYSNDDIHKRFDAVCKEIWTFIFS